MNMLQWFVPQNKSEKRRFFELFMVFVVCVCLVLVARLETRILEMSTQLADNQMLYRSVVFFGLVNLNVLLLIGLSLLIFRNVIKHIVEKQKSFFGSKLRSRLIFVMLVFSLLPSGLIAFITVKSIGQSFDGWFSPKVGAAINSSIEASEKLYKGEIRRTTNILLIAAERVSLQQQVISPRALADSSTSDEILVNSTQSSSIISGPPFVSNQLDCSRLNNFAKRYNLDRFQVYDVYLTADCSGQGEVTTRQEWLESDQALIKDLTTEKIPSSIDLGGISISVVSRNQQDIVKGVLPIIKNGELVGYVVAESWFTTQIVGSLKQVLDEYSKLRPSAQYSKITYFILLALMVFLILFASIWGGFYVSRTFAQPLSKLADATKEVAMGNYGIRLAPAGNDETGWLVESFNKMTQDLDRQQKNLKLSQHAIAQANEELAEKKQLLEVVLGNITSGVMSVSFKGKILSYNAAAAQLLVIPSTYSQIGKEFQKVISAKLYRDLWLPVSESLKTNDSFNGQVDVETPSGDSLTLLVYASIVADRFNKNLGYLLVIDDASEQIKSQKIAAWKDVARRISHEIKNPITPIKINSQRLLKRFKNKFSGTDAQIFESCLETILSQVDSLKTMVDEFSYFSKMPNLNLTNVNIGSLVSTILQFYRLGYPQIEMNFSGPKNLLLKMDKEKMNRLLVNLINNAIDVLEDWTNPILNIEVVHDKKAEMVFIHVLDNGPGFEQSSLNQVLQPYFSTKEKGTGLGLSIVNEIVLEHGGHLRISSSEYGGARVSIELPNSICVDV